MLSAELDDKKKELLKSQQIATSISEQLFKDGQKLSKCKDRQSETDKELGVSHVLINDISKLRSKRRVYCYISTLAVLVMMAVIFGLRLYRREELSITKSQ